MADASSTGRSLHFNTHSSASSLVESSTSETDECPPPGKPARNWPAVPGPAGQAAAPPAPSPIAGIQLGTASPSSPVESSSSPRTRKTEGIVLLDLMMGVMERLLAEAHAQDISKADFEDCLKKIELFAPKVKQHYEDVASHLSADEAIQRATAFADLNTEMQQLRADGFAVMKAKQRKKAADKKVLDKKTQQRADAAKSAETAAAPSVKGAPRRRAGFAAEPADVRADALKKGYRLSLPDPDADAIAEAQDLADKAKSEADNLLGKVKKYEIDAHEQARQLRPVRFRLNQLRDKHTDNEKIQTITRDALNLIKSKKKEAVETRRKGLSWYPIRAFTKFAQEGSSHLIGKLGANALVPFIVNAAVSAGGHVPIGVGVAAGAAATAGSCYCAYRLYAKYPEGLKSLECKQTILEILAACAIPITTTIALGARGFAKLTLDVGLSFLFKSLARAVRQGIQSPLGAFTSTAGLKLTRGGQPLPRWDQFFVNIIRDSIYGALSLVLNWRLAQHLNVALFRPGVDGLSESILKSVLQSQGTDISGTFLPSVNEGVDAFTPDAALAAYAVCENAARRALGYDDLPPLVVENADPPSASAGDKRWFDRHFTDHMQIRIINAAAGADPLNALATIAKELNMPQEQVTALRALAAFTGGVTTAWRGRSLTKLKDVHNHKSQPAVTEGLLHAPFVAGYQLYAWLRGKPGWFPPRSEDLRPNWGKMNPRDYERLVEIVQTCLAGQDADYTDRKDSVMEAALDALKAQGLEGVHRAEVLKALVEKGHLRDSPNTATPTDLEMGDLDHIAHEANSRRGFYERLTLWAEWAALDDEAKQGAGKRKGRNLNYAQKCLHYAILLVDSRREDPQTAKAAVWKLFKAKFEPETATRALKLIKESSDPAIHQDQATPAGKKLPPVKAMAKAIHNTVIRGSMTSSMSTALWSAAASRDGDAPDDDVADIIGSAADSWADAKPDCYGRMPPKGSKGLYHEKQRSTYCGIHAGNMVAMYATGNDSAKLMNEHSPLLKRALDNNENRVPLQDYANAYNQSRKVGEPVLVLRTLTRRLKGTVHKPLTDAQPGANFEPEHVKKVCAWIVDQLKHKLGLDVSTEVSWGGPAPELDQFDVIGLTVRPLAGTSWAADHSIVVAKDKADGKFYIVDPMKASPIQLDVKSMDVAANLAMSWYTRGIGQGTPLSWDVMLPVPAPGAPEESRLSVALEAIRQFHSANYVTGTGDDGQGFTAYREGAMSELADVYLGDRGDIGTAKKLIGAHMLECDRRLCYLDGESNVAPEDVKPKKEALDIVSGALGNLFEFIEKAKKGPVGRTKVTTTATSTTTNVSTRSTAISGTPLISPTGTPAVNRKTKLVQPGAEKKPDKPSDEKKPNNEKKRKGE